MAERMLKFTTVQRSGPPKREADSRTGDFQEIYGEYLSAKAAEQSARC